MIARLSVQLSRLHDDDDNEHNTRKFFFPNTLLNKHISQSQEEEAQAILLKSLLRAMVVGSVGRAVASDSRGPRFESRQWQNLSETFLLSTVLKRRK